MPFVCESMLTFGTNHVLCPYLPLCRPSLFLIRNVESKCQSLEYLSFYTELPLNDTDMLHGRRNRRRPPPPPPHTTFQTKMSNFLKIMQFLTQFNELAPHFSAAPSLSKSYRHPCAAVIGSFINYVGHTSTSMTHRCPCGFNPHGTRRVPSAIRPSAETS